MREWIRQMGNRGFTVLELFMAIAIAGILIGAGMPSFLALIQSSRLDGATRQVLSEIRAVQSLAVTRGGIFGFHWGGDPLVGMVPSVYRIESNPTGNCADWPPPGASKADPNPDVITDWFDLAGEYSGITITAVQDNGGTPLGGVIFNSRGASVNPCTVVNFPVTVTVLDGLGATRTIQIRSAGSMRIL